MRTLLPLAICIPLGLCWGSFLNCLAFRFAKNQPVLFDRSHCESCTKTLHPIHLIPLLSVLALRGRSACCQKPISISHPIIELLTALTLIALYLHCGLTQEFLYATTFFSFLALVSLIDLRSLHIPDTLTFAALAITLLYKTYTSFPDLSVPLESLLAALTASGFYFWVAAFAEYFLKKEALGLGDVKLAAVFGATLGLPSTICILFEASLLGLILLLPVLYLRHGKAALQQRIPFAPLLCAAAALEYLGLGSNLYFSHFLN